MPDLLFRSAKEFEKVVGYNCLYTLDCGIEFEVAFRADQFHHLAGLHYLTDLDMVSGHSKYLNKRSVFNQILSGKISHLSLAKSTHFPKIESRLQWFCRFDEVLHAKIIVDFDYTKVPRTKLNAKYLLYQYIEDACAYLIVALRYDAKTGVYVPESFLVEASDYYIRNQISYEVDSVKFIHSGTAPKTTLFV